MSLGKRLREARKAKGFTQVYVAKKLGITNTALSNYERDERDPDTSLLNRFAEFYGVSIDWLMGRTDIPETPEQKIKTAIEDDPELLEFWEELTKRDDLQLLFKQVRELSPKEIKKIIRVIKAIEDEDSDT